MFWDSAQSLTKEGQRNLFEQNVASLFPAFYGLERFASDDYGNPNSNEIADFVNKRRDRAVTSFPDIREAYLKKMNAFDSNIQINLKKFKTSFPDFTLTTPIYLVHSLGEMDGGTRTLSGDYSLIFGVDGMVRYHDFDDETAFFYHELFHVYHEPSFGQCDLIWCDAWREGLAVYVASQLHPGASESELLLDFPKGLANSVRGQLLMSLKHLESVNQSNDNKAYKGLFQTDTDATGLPARRCYYLGYLIAQEASKNHTLATLASLSMAESLSVYEKSLSSLIARHTRQDSL